jgi:hypothetical protein
VAGAGSRETPSDPGKKAWLALKSTLFLSRKPRKNEKKREKIDK